MIRKKPAVRKEDDSREVLIKGVSVGDYTKEDKPKPEAKPVAKKEEVKPAKEEEKKTRSN